MGWFDGFKLAAGVASAAPSSNVIPFERPTSRGIISPWQDGTLAPIVASDIWGLANTPMTRQEAMRVPSIAKARSIIHAVIGSRPLRAYEVDDNGQQVEVKDQPTFLYRTNSGVSPRMRTKLTLDDHLFCEASLWVCNRGADVNGKPGPILDAWHVPYDMWKVAEDGRILVNEKPAKESEVLWIPGPGPGLLVSAAETIRAARNMDAAWQARVESPYPAFILKDTEDTVWGEGELEGWLDTIAEARRNPKRAVMYLPSNLELDQAASESTDLFETGRNALRLDIANHTALPAAMLEGSVSTASLTYSTQEGKRNELFDYSVPYWSDPFADRLSLDDVVPRGQSVAFDFSDFLTPTASPTGPTEQD